MSKTTYWFAKVDWDDSPVLVKHVEDEGWFFDDGARIGARLDLRAQIPACERLLELDPDLEPELPSNHYIQTASGARVDFLNPRARTLHIEDIAAGLARTIRYTGHLGTSYTVAQHCVLLSWLCEPEHVVAALMHDASEAYLGDVNANLKPLLPEYLKIEDRFQEVLAKKFDFEHPMPEALKGLDVRVREYEIGLYAANPESWGQRYVPRAEAVNMLRRSIPGTDFDSVWPAQVAYEKFMQRWYRVRP